MTFFIVLHLNSKAYSAAILSINLHLYQLKVPNQLTQRTQFLVKCYIFKSAIWVL